MSNSVFPTLNGISIEATRSPLWNTMKLETPSGREYRGTFQLYPRYRYTLVFNYLRDTSLAQDYRTLLGFFNSMRGGFDTFLFTDPDDNSATNQNFGTGDGSTKTFQLLRTLGNFVEPVYDINGAPTIKVAGVTKTAGSDYTIDSTGGVHFTAAPAGGAALTWTGSFYWRCVFEDDTIDFDKFMNLLWSVKKVSLKTVKP
jgi:uncharacterized protein (TIGR02217 family)